MFLLVEPQKQHASDFLKLIELVRDEFHGQAACRDLVSTDDEAIFGIGQTRGGDVTAHAVARAAVAEGEVVGVMGGGPIGQAVLLAALAAGASRVVVVEPVAERRELLVRLGAEAIEAESGALASAVGGPLPVVIDAVGSTQTVDEALASCRRGGRVVLVGMHSPRLDLSAYAISTEERSLIGAFCYTDTQLRDTAVWAAGHTSVLRHLVSEIVTLDQAPEAFRALAGGTTGQSKILVTLEAD